MFLVRMFGIPLLLTIAAEEIVALFWGVRKLRDFLTILWVNVVTNLSVTALRYLSNQNIPSQAWRNVILIVLEVAVLFAEWGLFRKFLIKNRHPFLMSLTMNAASYGAGLLLPVILRFMAQHGI